MKTIFIIRDDLTKTYGPPIFHTNEGTLARELQNALKQKVEGSLMHSNPENFSVWKCGSYDDLTGKFVLSDANTHVFTLSDLSQ